MGAAEPETAKAAHAQTVLEIFAGKEVIEKWRIGYNARRDAINHVSTVDKPF